MNYQKTILLGRLTQEPRMGEKKNRDKVANFSIAVNQVWTGGSGDKQERTEFFNVVVYGRQAEVIEKFVHKSDLIFIEGKWQKKEWQDKKGELRQSWEVIAESIQIQF